MAISNRQYVLLLIIFVWIILMRVNMLCIKPSKIGQLSVMSVFLVAVILQLPVLDFRLLSYLEFELA